MDTPEELDRLSLERALDPFQLLEKQRARISSEHWRWSHLSDEPKAWRNKGQTRSSCRDTFCFRSTISRNLHAARNVNSN